MLRIVPRESQKKVSAHGLLYFLRNLELDKWLFSGNYMENSDCLNDVALEQGLREYLQKEI